MRLAPFEPTHLFAFTPQGPQKPYVEFMTPDIAAAASGYFAFTGFDDREAIIGCAGLAPFGADLVAWAVFSPLLFAHKRAVVRAVKAGLDLHVGRRILAHVDPAHDKAARFAEALDFAIAGRVAHPNGRDVLLYARER